MTDQPETAPETDDIPVPQYRGLKAAVIIMGVLLVVGFIVVFSTIIYRVVKPSEGSLAARSDKGPGFGVIESRIPEGAKTGRIIADGERLSVEVTGPEGSEIIVYDVDKGIELGRIRLKSR